MSGLLFTAFGVTLAASTPVVVRGLVTDTAGAPIGGATVTALDAGIKLAVTECSQTGRFSLTVAVLPATAVTIRATAVGFQDGLVTVTASQDTLSVTIICPSKIIERSGIEVTAARPDVVSAYRWTSAQIERGAFNSVVQSNPLAVVRHPQMAHFGLNLASQFRIDGSIPRYYLNGMPIGADPTHFGIFAVVPAPAVSELYFSPQGTSAVYPVPSVIDFRSTSQFTPKHQGEASLSVVDATASYLWSTERYFASATVRRSLMDKLASQVNLGSSRHEIPVPDFTDLFLGLGLKLSNRLQLLYDQYHVSDALEYALSQKSGAEGEVVTNQESSEDHASAKLAYASGDWYGSGSVGFRNGHRTFMAYPTVFQNGDLFANFGERYRNYQANGDIGYAHGIIDLKAGVQYEAIPNMELHLRQNYWNLLSPFAHSDNLNLFQSAVNEFYAVYDGSIGGYSDGVYASGAIRLGRFLLENGVRYETISYLKRPNALATRHALKITTGDNSDLKLFYGTFFETPITTAMESYQVPVRIDLVNLLPIKTWLATCSYRYGPVTVEALDKEISNQPVLTPDFSHIWIDTVHQSFWDPRFLQVHSAGKSTFTGISVALDLPHVLSPQMDCYFSYAYSRARKIIDGVDMPHDLDAPHRLVAQLDYRINRAFQLGGEWQIHTGYPYSPHRSYILGYGSHIPQYLEDLQEQNTLRFPVNASLNIHASWVFGRASVYLAIINVTNHANAMISSGTDLIYDSGLIPNIGFRYQF